MNKPLIFISKCIEIDHCRYDGSQISSSFVKRLKKHVDILTVCPEVSIGLSIPREAIRIIDDGQERLVYSLTGTDVTTEMNRFSKDYMTQIKDKKIHGFILKNRSPSCGIRDVKVYKSHGKSMSLDYKTSGFFGRAILTHFPEAIIEDEGRLMNYNIREHFLTRVYLMCAFDEVMKAKSMSRLIRFHGDNKYLLMAHHQLKQKELGKIVANHEHLEVEQVISNYQTLLIDAMSHPMKRGTNINMLMHLLGYFKKDINKEEKAYFLDVLEQYKMKKVPFSVPIAIINSWVIRFDEPYLKTQTILRPFPIEILDVTDSGKGID